MADFNFGSISQTNNSGVNQVGENHASVNTSGQQPSLPADLNSVLQAVRQAVPAPVVEKPASEAPKAPEAVSEAPSAPVAYTSGNADPSDWSDNQLSDDDDDDMFRQLEAIAKMDKEEQEKPENKDKMGKALTAIAKYGPAVAQQLAIFGNSALETLADTNPVVGGIYAVCKANLPEEDK